MLGFVLFLVVVALAAVAAWVVWFRLVTSEPNEWMLVLRDGVVVRSGIGITHIARWGDQIARFPSKLNKVNFAAEQVTREMQGVGVKGVLIWTIFREGDGPYKAYRSMGEDLRRQEPTDANDKLREMSNAIVRHRIANSSVADILTKRDVVRNEIRTEMNKLVNGWGVWLETVEITDVQILSNTLFTNLQTPFREDLRAKAEVIKMNTDQELAARRGETAARSATLEADASAERDIFRASQALRVSTEAAKLFERDAELKRKRLALDFEAKAHAAALDEKLREAAAAAAHAEQQESLDSQIALERRNQAFVAAEAETKARRLGLQLRRQELLAAHELRTAEAWLELENKLHANADFRFAALEACEEVYRRLPVKEIRQFNYGAQAGDAGVLARLVSGLSAVTQETK